MRKSIILLVTILLCLNTFGQVPEKMSYQAVIRNSNSQLVVNTSISIRITILKSENLISVYSETQYPTTNENGLISINIGNKPEFNSIDWSTGIYFLKTEIDLTGGSDFTISGMSQLLSVPYALYAKTSGNGVSSNLIEDLEKRLDLLSQRIQALEDSIFPINNFVFDLEGNKYNFKLIGNQTWMTENLRVTKYNDSTEIPYIKENSDWISLDSAGFCWYNNDTLNKNTFGGLYNWYAVETGKLCPLGWHVASDNEWKELEMYLGLTQEEADVEIGWRGTDQGERLKSTTGWNNDGNGNNSTGFNALPGGMRHFENTETSFYYLGVNGFWWTSTELNIDSKWDRCIGAEHDNIYRNYPIKTYGLSVRCIKDNDSK